MRCCGMAFRDRAISSKPVAITVMRTSSDIASSITAPKIILASLSTLLVIILAASSTSYIPRSLPPVILNKTPLAPSIETSRSGESIACLAASIARFSPEPRPMPMSAETESDITLFTSAKSTLISPGVVTRSAMPCTPCLSTSSTVRNASRSEVILQIIDKKTSLLDAFRTVDDVLRQGVQGIADLVTTPGLINVDFADVKSVMSDSGSALMGIGRGSGENRAIEAAKQAIDSPLLEVSIDGARGVLFNITGGKDLGMYEVDEAAKIITKSVDSDAKIIFGAVIDEAMSDKVRITVIATGFDEIARSRKAIPQQRMAPISAPLGFGVTQEISETPAKSTYSPKAVDEDGEDEENEELDIPAFIRKKMK